MFHLAATDLVIAHPFAAGSPARSFQGREGRRGQHRIGDRVVALRGEAPSRADAVALFAILPELGFAHHASDLDFDADDHLEHGFNVVGRRIAHFPGSLACDARFVNAREPRYNALHELRIVDDANISVYVEHLIIPRRHLTLAFNFA